jgi:hypothetical protein
MIMTRASRVFEALEPSSDTHELPEWLVAVQAERKADRARLAAEVTRNRRIAQVFATSDYPTF